MGGKFGSSLSAGRKCVEGILKRDGKANVLTQETGSNRIKYVF
jgi:hypothetical protein